jgi:hypothetical protein
MKLRYRIAVTSAAIFLTAFAADTVLAKKWFDNPNAGYCKSGARVNDVKKCKEQGGTK